MIRVWPPGAAHELLSRSQWLFAYALPLGHTVCSGETAVRYRIMGLYGSVVPARRVGDAPPLRYEGVSRRDSRGRLTLVSDTPADTSLQQRLPKFLTPKDVWLSIFQGAAGGHGPWKIPLEKVRLRGRRRLARYGLVRLTKIGEERHGLFSFSMWRTLCSPARSGRTCHIFCPPLRAFVRSGRWRT